ncbi:hypothetical protein C6A85_07655, partial [Mycobacterium sp. ITM-2017-0098]
GGTKERAFEVLDKLQIVDISNNLGDAKSLITHPATTTHRAMGGGGRMGDQRLGVAQVVGDVDDLQLVQHLERAFLRPSL